MASWRENNGSGPLTVVDTGTLTITGGNAEGISAMGEGSITVSENGTLNVTGTSGTTT